MSKGRFGKAEDIFKPATQKIIKEVISEKSEPAKKTTPATPKAKRGRPAKKKRPERKSITYKIDPNAHKLLKMITALTGENQNDAINSAIIAYGKAVSKQNGNMLESIIKSCE